MKKIMDKGGVEGLESKALVGAAKIGNNNHRPERIIPQGRFIEYLLKPVLFSMRFNSWVQITLKCILLFKT